jgi:uncharacterized protein (TIGR01777 family)
MIGTPLSAVLAQAGQEVIVLSRNPDRHTFPKGVQGAQWDTNTTAGWGELLDGAGAVINLAGENISGDGLLPARWTEERKQRIRDSRRMAGLALVKAISEANQKPRVFFQVSGIDYYAPGDKLVDEQAPPGSTFLASVVTEDWEPSTAPVEEMGVRRIIGRLGVVLSTEGGALPPSLLQFRLFAGGKLGDGQQWMSWVHVADAVRAIQFLVENTEAEGPYNIVAPQPVRNKELTKELGSIMGRPSLIPVPGSALKLVLGDVSTLVLDGRPVSSGRLQELGFEFLYPDLHSALRDLLK